MSVPRCSRADEQPALEFSELMHPAILLARSIREVAGFPESLAEIEVLTAVRATLKGDAHAPRQP